MDLNLTVFSLPYSKIVWSGPAFFESTTGLWQNSVQEAPGLIPVSGSRYIDNLDSLRSACSQLNHNGTSTNSVTLIEPQINSPLVTVAVAGNEIFINSLQTAILHAHRLVGFRRIAVPEKYLQAFSPTFTIRLNNLAVNCNVEILVAKCVTNFQGDQTPSDQTFLYILGNAENVALAEPRARVLMDTMLGNFLVRKLELAASFIPCVGGPELANFTEVARDLAANIYLPQLMPHCPRSTICDFSGPASLWITSHNPLSIKMAEALIRDLMTAVEPSQKAPLFIQKADLDKTKVDIMTLFFQKDILDVMVQNGTHIQLPSLGEARNNSIVVQGATQQAVADSMLKLCALSCQILTLDMKFQKGPASSDFEFFLISLVNRRKTCVLRYNEFGVSIVGIDSEVYLLVDELGSGLHGRFFSSKLASEEGSGFEVSLSLELGHEQREFIAGKKNGKIIKILNLLSKVPYIKFRRLNEYNFVVRLGIQVEEGPNSLAMSSAFMLLSKGLGLLRMELPCELQFNIPDVFHKSIIGNGGLIIQSIMKRHNVFVKFTSSSKKGDGHLPGRTLMQFHRNSNVLVKCPAKNLKSILPVKHELDQLVQQCCDNRCPLLNGVSTTYNTIGLKLLKCQYRAMVRHTDFNLGLVLELEADFSAYIAFPKSLADFGNTSTYTVYIKGNESKCRQCALELASRLPKSTEVRISHCPMKFEELISEGNEEFVDRVIAPFKLLLKTELSIHMDGFGENGSHSVVLSSYDEKALVTAKSELRRFLQEKRFEVLEAGNVEVEVIISQFSSPRKSSPRKFALSSPSKQWYGSPTRQNSPTKSPTKSGSPYKNTLQPIVNQALFSTKKTPALGHQNPPKWPL